MKKNRKPDASPDAPVLPSGPRIDVVTPGSLAALAGLGFAASLLAAFLWAQLVISRSGGVSFCGPGDSDCASLWNGSFASWVHRMTGLPVAAWGLVWGVVSAALPLLAACLLTEDECVLTNVPRIGDVEVMARLLVDVGAEVDGIGTTTLRVRAPKVVKHEPDRARLHQALQRLCDGIDVERVKRRTYMLCGGLAGVAGLLLTARLDAADPKVGVGYELDSIAAVVIGGTSLSGGRGSVLGTVLGCLIIGVLNNGLVLLGVSPDWQLVVKGIVILATVAIDRAGSAKE